MSGLATSEFAVLFAKALKAQLLMAQNATAFMLSSGSLVQLEIVEHKHVYEQRCNKNSVCIAGEGSEI